MAESLGSETTCLSQTAGVSQWFLKLCFAEVRSPSIVSYKYELSFTGEILTTVWAGNPHAVVEQDYDQNSSIGVIFFVIFQSAATQCLRPRQDFSTGTAGISGRPQDFRRRMWFMQDLVPSHFSMPESRVFCAKDWAECFVAHSK